MTHLATLFNINYLGRGLALIESLNKHFINRFTIYILCLDNETYDFFNKKSKHENIIPLTLTEIEGFYPGLLAAKANRSTIEYYFTLSPALPLYILKRFNIEQITTLDADIFFFSNPEKLFKEVGKHSISITPHNFSKELKNLEIWGKYNVSFQSFKNNSEGLACLENWKNQCLEWCFDRMEGNRFADQKYLDSWVFEYADCYEINIPGTGIAPWNLNSYNISNSKKTVKVGKDNLIFYHFHQLRLLKFNIISLGLDKYYVIPTKAILNNIYKPYIKILQKKNKKSDSHIKRSKPADLSLWGILTLPNYYLFINIIIFETSILYKIFLKIKIIVLNFYGKTY